MLFGCGKPFLFFVLKLFDTFLRYGLVFRHGAAEFGDGLPHFSPDFEMCLIGLCLALDVVTAQFFFGLGSAEEVGGQLASVHVIQYFLALFQPFAFVDALVVQTAVKSFIAVVLKGGVFHGFFHACFFGGSGQVAVVGADLSAQQQALFVFAELAEGLRVLQFLAAGLHGKVGLPGGDDVFVRVAVLHDQVAGIAGKVEVCLLPLCA